MSRMWKYKRNDEEFGPIAEGELRRIASEGQLLPSDLVHTEGMQDWQPASKVKGLFVAGTAPYKAIHKASERADDVSRRLWFLDLKFEQFATPRLIGFVFAMALLFLVLSAVGITIYALFNYPVLQAVIGCAIVYIELIFLAVCFRVFLEMMLVVFRISDHLSYLKYLENTK